RSAPPTRASFVLSRATATTPVWRSGCSSRGTGSPKRTARGLPKPPDRAAARLPLKHSGRGIAPREGTRVMRLPRALLSTVLFFAFLPVSARAGSTGGIVGRVVDAATQAPIAGAVVTASAPSQTATTDASGSYRFLTLVPDTYTLAVNKSSYDSVVQPGLSVFADQVQTFNVAMNKTLRTIAHVTSREAANLIKPGTTSDVYSVNAAGQKAAGSLIGPGGLSNAYGAIQSAPGVAIDQGEAGWFQMVHIRGGDIDQVGYELDGIPVNRVYDNAPQTM